MPILTVNEKVDKAIVVKPLVDEMKEAKMRQETILKLLKSHDFASEEDLDATLNLPARTIIPIASNAKGVASKKRSRFYFQFSTDPSHCYVSTF